MISLAQMLHTLLWAGLALLLFEFLWYLLENRLNLLGKFPAELLEKPNLSLFISRYIMQFAFLVIAPTIIYGWVYTLLPFYGLRAGVACAIVLFVLGAVPFSVVFISRIKLPLSFTLFQLAGHLLRLILVFGIISYIYIL